MANKKRVDETRSQPLTLAALREYGALDGFSPPGDFDPNDRWENIYRIWLVGRKDSGFLRIEHEPASDGKSVTLNVEMFVLQAAKTFHRTKAKLQCAGDVLSTPQSWEIESEILDKDMEPIEVAKVRDKVVPRNRPPAMRDESAAFTSNWSLFDAVQRLPGKDTTALEFGLLEDLDLLKEKQRLSYWQSDEFDMDEHTLQLVGYQQIGQGILPYQYWVDDQHRLLFVIGGIRAYIFDPNAKREMEELAQRLARRAKR